MHAMTTSFTDACGQERVFDWPFADAFGSPGGTKRKTMRVAWGCAISAVAAMVDFGTLMGVPDSWEHSSPPTATPHCSLNHESCLESRCCVDEAFGCFKRLHLYEAECRPLALGSSDALISRRPREILVRVCTRTVRRSWHVPHGPAHLSLCLIAKGLA